MDSRRRLAPLLPLGAAFALALAYAFLLAAAPEGSGATSTPALRWLLAALLVASGVVGVQFVRHYVLDVAFVRTQGHRAPALLHAVVVVVATVAVALLVAGAVFDQKLTEVLIGGTALSLVLGLALQDTLGNFFAGLALQAEQPFRFGDVVHVDGLVGRVESFNWRGTTIVTVRGSRTVIPNGALARAAIEVFPRDASNRRAVPVPAPYDVRPARVARVLRRAAAEVPGVSASPAPSVRLAAFDGSSVSYEVVYSAEEYLRVEAIDAQIRERAWYAFAREGIEIPYPHEVQVPYAPPPPADEDPAEHRAEWLAAVPLFAPLTLAEQARLAVGARTVLFGPGEAVIRAGEPGGSLFVVRRGSVEILAPHDGGGRVRVEEVGPGEVIGEMSLLTGEPRSADVRAVGEAELLEVRKPEMRGLLDGNAALAAALAAEVERRVERRDGVFAGLRPDDDREGPGSLLERIRRFFDLDEA